MWGGGALYSSLSIVHRAYNGAGSVDDLLNRWGSIKLCPEVLRIIFRSDNWCEVLGGAEIKVLLS